MKRRASSSSSPYSSSSCSNSPSSSSSSCIESLMVQAKQALKPTPKARPRTRTRRSRTSRDTNSVASPKSRSSVYRGVTRHRWTGRFEAHLWDKFSWNNIQNKKGRQVYLGAYDIEEDAARTYDLAALKYWGPNTTLNFPVEMYVKEVKEMEKMTKEEYLNSLRRQSNGFSRGVSKYRGVARHHHNGRWEARIGRVCGNKYLYLGTFSTQEEAAEAYDKAALEYRGPNAVTNFNKNKYADMLKNIAISSDQDKDEQARCEQDDTQANEDTNCVPLKESPPTTQDHQDRDNHRAPLQTTVDELESEATCTSINLQSMAMMDPTEVQGHPWDDICLDTGFNDFPFFNIPMDQVPDVFDYQGFDDNIDFIFDGPVNDTMMFLQDALSGSDRCNVEGIALDVVNVPDASPSPTSSCRSTTSVCSNM